MPVATRCLMEEVAWRAGEPVCDRPAVTHPVLALLAQQVHDRTSVSGRPALLHQVPALVGARTDDPRAGWVLVGTCARRALASNPPPRVRRVADRLVRRADRRTAWFGHRPRAAGRVGSVIALACLPDLAVALRCVLAVAGPPRGTERDAALADLLAAATAAVRALGGSATPPRPAPEEPVLSPA